MAVTVQALEVRAVVVQARHQPLRQELLILVQVVVVVQLQALAVAELLSYAQLLLILVRALWLLLVELKQRSLVMVLMVI